MNEHQPTAVCKVLRLLTVVILGAGTAIPGVVRAQVFVPSPGPSAPLGGALATGQVAAIHGTSLLLVLRAGNTLTVDLRSAQAAHLAPPLYVGEFLQVQGTLIGAGILNAAAVIRAKSAPAAWSADIL